MIVIFSTHAKQRMKERNIDERTVRQCLSDPDKLLSTNGESVGARRANEKVIVVIFKKTGDIHFVITAFSSSKIQKYLK